MPSDSIFTGWIDGIKTGSRDGKVWTSFCIHEPYMWQGEQREERWMFVTYAQADLQEGGWYRVMAKPRRRKGEDGSYRTEMYLTAIVPEPPTREELKPMVQGAKVAEGAREYARKAAPTPPPQRQAYQPQQQMQRGPEAFVDDDIPF